MGLGHEGASFEDASKIHQFYMNIINSVPDIVYWLDVDCKLKGCNNQFVALLGLSSLKDFKSSPYEPMVTRAHWNKQRVESIKMDDMQAIFTGEARYQVEERAIVTDQEQSLYFLSTRVPTMDENKKVTGLIVVLSPIPVLKDSKPKEASFQKLKSEEGLSLKENHLPTVLMIEDNVIAQNVEKALFTALNCQVDIADSGESALKLFGPGKYDLVLMDIGLEGTSGYVVAKQLRDMEKSTAHHVPIIALTGYEADVVKYDCEQYFMEGAISKPLTSEQAGQIIDHYVHNKDIPVRGLKTS